ncbi:MAG: hypothetical protein GY858_08580 [Candidatus Omnitrophica bacterium]|nr:hypothetical protein [Candidatus Omnitrophota bacterium]
MLISYIQVIIGNLRTRHKKKFNCYKTNGIINYWDDVPNQYNNIERGQYIITPNHVHGIINIVGVDLCVDPDKNKISNDDHKINHNGRTQGSAPTILSLSNIIQRLKTLTTKKYIDGIKNNNWSPFAKRLWQRDYHDHIIRNKTSLNKIREYITNNPINWQFDVENPDRVGKMESDTITA